MVKVWTPFGRMMRTRSPTEKWYFCAVPSSMTTSSEVVGASPVTRCRGEICELGSKESPRFGGPLVPIAVPSLATYCAPFQVTFPSAILTPGTSRTVVTSDSGIGLRTSPLPPGPLVENWETPRTWKSTFW